MALKLHLSVSKVKGKTSTPFIYHELSLSNLLYYGELASGFRNFLYDLRSACSVIGF